jgi:Bacterial Ig-like domain
MSSWTPVATTTVKNTTVTAEASLAGSVTVANEGDLLIVGFNALVTGTITFGLSDTAGNTWSLGAQSSNGTLRSGFFWAESNAAGPTTITLTSSVAGFMTFTVNEISLPGGTSGLTLATTAVQSSTTNAAATGNMTFSSTSGNSFVYGTFSPDNGSAITHTPGTGFTPLASFVNADSYIGYFDEYQITSASPIAATAAWSAISITAGVGGVFQIVEPIGYTITGPSTGAITEPSGTFAITPTVPITDTVALTASVPGGTFTPSSLSWSASDEAQTFIYAAPTASTGTAITITATSSANQRVSGSPFSYYASAVLTAGWVSKSAKLAIIGNASFLPVFSGAFSPYQPAIVKAVNSTPTFEVNGRTISIYGPLWQTLSLTNSGPNVPFDSPVVAYQLLCGSVQSIPMESGGTSPYTNPTAVWNGDGGGEGLTVGTPIMAKGLFFTLTNPGSGFPNAFTKTTLLSGGTFTAGIGSAANTIALATNGSISSVLPLTGGALGYGVGYLTAPGTQTITAPTVTLSGTLTSGSAIVTGLTSTAGFGIGATATGTGIPAGATVTAVDSATSATLSANATASGTVSIVFAGTNATYTCTVGNYILEIPPTNVGSGFTSPPTFTITDTGSGAGAVTAPIMTGPLSTDVVTFSAAPQWLNTSLGNTTEASSETLTNFVGTLEGPVGHLSGFTATPELLLGFNGPSTQANPFVLPLFMGKNKLLAADNWKMSTGTTSLTFDENFFPMAWTAGGTITSQVYGGGGSSFFPSYCGPFGSPLQWTLVYDDANAGTASATPVSITTGNGGINSCTLVGSQTVSGTTVTQIYDVAFTAIGAENSNTAALNLNLVAPSDGLFHLSNMWLFAPNNTIDRSNRYAVDDNVVRNLTGPSGRGPSQMRFMDSFGGPGGQINYVDASDIQNPNFATWQIPYPTPAWQPIGTAINANGGVMLSGTSVAIAARFLNTNAASTTYSFSSTKVYSTQAFAVSGTDSFGSYLDMTAGPLGVNDNGTLVYPNFGHASQNCVVELRFPSPHGFKTGQLAVSRSPIFNGTLTSGSATITGLTAHVDTPTANVEFLVPGLVITGTGIPASALTVTGTITSGSAVVTGLSSITNILGQGGAAGSLTPGTTVTGTGIPAGTTVTTVNNTATLSSSTLTLSANATSSGTVSLTFSVPTTILSVSGSTITMSANATASGTEAIAIQSIIPTTAPIGTFNLVPGQFNISGQSMAFVTGPNTMAFQADVGLFTEQTQQFVASTTEIPIYLFLQLLQPSNPGTIPYEFAASIVSNFPNCDLWLNLSYIGSPGYYQAVAQKVAPLLGPTNNLILENGNEHWNDASPFQQFPLLTFLTKVPAYLPTGTLLWPFTNAAGQPSGYTTNGTPLANQDQTYALYTANVFDVIVNAFVEAGIPASRIKRSYGTQWSDPTITTNMVAMVTEFDIPADAFHVGPYSNNSNAPSITNACNPAGYPIGAPGNLPVDAINDYYRTVLFYSASYWATHQAHQNAIGPLGIELFGYEVAVQNIVPETSIDFSATSADGVYHPSHHDAQWCYYLSLQLGNQNNQFGGLTRANYFSLYDTFNPYGWSGSGNNIWKLADGVSQPPGLGTSNQFLTSQGGAPGTRPPLGFTQTNESVALEAFQNWNNQTTPFFAPGEVSLAPANGSTGAATSATVAVQFNEPMAADTITTSTFTLTQGSTSIAGSVSYNSDTETATFTPTSALSNGTTYTAQVSTGVQNTEGTGLSAPITWSFIVGQPIPTVSAISPASGATGVSTTTAVSAAFSLPMNASTLSLSLSPMSPVFGPSYNSSTNVATWTSPSLQFGTTYTATLTGTSQAGSPLASPEVWSFTTSDAPPKGTSVVPSIGFQFAAPTSGTVVFTVTVSATNTRVSGTTTYNSGTQVATFTPTSPFQIGTKYLVTISGATAADGTAMVPVTFPFTPGTLNQANWFAGLSRPRPRP